MKNIIKEYLKKLGYIEVSEKEIENSIFENNDAIYIENKEKNISLSLEWFYDKENGEKMDIYYITNVLNGEYIGYFKKLN